MTTRPDDMVTITHADGSTDEVSETATMLVNYFMHVMEKAYERFQKTGKHGLVDPTEIEMFEEYLPAQRAYEWNVRNLIAFGRTDVD